jgi:hypothetical protein
VVLAYAVVTSLFVANTVLLKLSILWLNPQIKTAMALSALDVGELDEFPHESFKILFDVVWIMSSTMGFLFFGIELILVSWIKFRRFSTMIPISTTVIMAPTMLTIVVVSSVNYVKQNKVINLSGARDSFSLA